MTARRKEVATVTSEGKITMPESVRQALGVDDGGKIAFVVDESGVRIERDDAEDPAILAFLSLLARDMEARPEALDMPQTLAARINELTAGMRIDPDAPIEGDVAL